MLLFTSDHSRKNRLVLPLHFEKVLKLSSGYAQIRYGARSCQVFVRFSDRLQNGQAVISENIAKKMVLPLFLNYQLRFAAHTIHVGPAIGILYVKRNEELASRLHKLTPMLEHLSQTGGSIVAFTLHGIDRKKKLVQGYIYHPGKKEWRKGTYSYPDAFMIKMGMVKRKWKKHFEAAMGRTFFNDFSAGKYKMHGLLQRNRKFRKHLPETVRIHRDHDIWSFLQSHRDAYLKPTNLSKGRGIVRIVKHLGRIDIYGQSSERKKRITFRNRRKAAAYLASIRKNNRYLIQRTIPPIMHQGRKVDFRIFLAKNASGRWQTMICLARYGEQGSIVSNESAGGEFKHAKTALVEVYGLSQLEADKIEHKMVRLSLQIAIWLDMQRLHCGKVAIDIALDHRLKPWIMEVQHFHPGTTGFQKLDPKAYEAILVQNVQYLIYLAGF